MIPIRHLIISALMISSFESGIAQKESVWKSYAQSVNFKYKLGFLIAHRESMAHLPMSHFRAYELSYDFHSRGHEGWEQANKNPIFGIVLSGIFNRNHEVLGNAFGVSGRVILPKKRWGKNANWQWNNNMAFGLGYLEKKFDVELNPKNIAISTHLNLLIILGTEIRYVKPNGFVALGLDFTHFSNGGTIKPNLGLNIPSLTISAGYMTKKMPYSEQLYVYERNALELNVIGVFSAKNNYEFHKQVFPVVGTNIHLTKSQGKRYRYAFGIDFLFNEANRQFLSSAPDQSFFKTLQIGAFNAYELELRKFVFSIGMGAYVYNPLNPHGWFYHRIGGRFHFSKRLFFNGYVRSHWAKADFFEVGIGYKIAL